MKEFASHTNDVGASIEADLQGVAVMGDHPFIKEFYRNKWNDVLTDGAYIPQRACFENCVSVPAKVKPTPGGGQVMFANIMAGIQVALEISTAIDCGTHWNIDTMLKEYENSGHASTIHVTKSFTFDEGDHTVWAGLQTEAEGLALFFGFAYAAGMVKTITVEGISPPDTPYLTWPDHIHVLQLIPFVAHGSDQNGDPIQYEIDWGDGTTFTTQPVASGQSVDVPHRYNKIDTYVITIKSIDCDGMESEFNTYTLHVPLDLTKQSATQQSQPTPQGQPSSQQKIIQTIQKLAMCQKQQTNE